MTTKKLISSLAELDSQTIQDMKDHLTERWDYISLESAIIEWKKLWLNVSISVMPEIYRQIEEYQD